jgi:hypothetical protein
VFSHMLTVLNPNTARSTTCTVRNRCSPPPG